MPLRRRRRRRALTRALALSAIALAGCKDKRESAPPDEPAARDYGALEERCEYVILIDGGSVETRAYTYALEGRETGVPESARLLASKSTATGLSTLTTRPKAAVAVLEEIMEGEGGALAAVPDGCHEQTPVAVMATAGMRRVAADEGETAGKAMYDALKVYLEGKFLDVRRVGTLSGDEQALFSWISVNYGLGSLTGDAPTSAALELGDSTLQVAYVSDKPEASDTEPVLFGGREHMVFRKSFLGYGGRDAREAHATKACFPKGLRDGAGNYAACRKPLDKLLTPESCERVTCAVAKPGSTEGAYSPGLPEERTFYAIGGFARARELLSLAEDATLADFAKAGQGLCGTPWKQLSAPPAASAVAAAGGDAGEAVTTDDAAAAEAPTSPPPPTPEELERACFESAWIPAFLERLGFTPDAKSIRWRARVGDTTELDASWVLGAAVCIASECR